MSVTNGGGAVPYAPLTIKQGDTYRRLLTVTRDGLVVDLTGVVLTMHIRAKGTSIIALEQPLTITDGANGKAQVVLTSSQTAALVAGVPHLYEVEMLSGAGEVTTIVEGAISVQADFV